VQFIKDKMHTVTYTCLSRVAENEVRVSWDLGVWTRLSESVVLWADFGGELKD